MSRILAYVGPIRTGVVGLGRAGWNIHVRLLRDDARFRIIAASDPEAGRREQACQELGCETFATAEQMIERMGLDLVVVASPSVYHRPHALMALKAGAHVVVEKPLAGSADEVDEMIAAAHAANRQLMPFQSRRLSPIHQQLQKVIQSGKLGRLLHIAYRRYNYIRRNDWQCVLANGGGLLRNHGSHILDQILDLVQSPVNRVMCQLERISSAGDAEDHVVVLMQTSSGVTVHVEISDGTAASETGPEWMFVGEQGTLTATDNEGTIRHMNPGEIPSRQLQDGLAAQGRRYGTSEKLPWNEQQFSVEGKPDICFYDQVHDTITRGRPFIFPPEQVRTVIAVLDDCRRQNPRFSGLRPFVPQPVSDATPGTGGSLIASPASASSKQFRKVRVNSS
ncbi:Gfo/Idh/MocA family protein [Phycisphaerales bacterium AB-hyl4]|uniref:Gfo/Idh/MocA family protein n=1 Tax=Natronomicrosphaera hydrolytica TaxID=3242702 RepID=A0ABV4U505_9BACT